MPSQALVPVFSGTLNGHAVQLCSARDLHHFLAVGRDFSNWIKERIAQYGFVEGQDYVIPAPTAQPATPDLESASFDSPNSANQRIPARSARQYGRGGDRRSRQYHLSLDMAKELAMVENNEQGRLIRRYFIECERRAQQGHTPPTLHGVPALAAPGQDMPKEIRQAINRHAYALSHEAYEDLRVWLQARVQRHCRTGRGEWLMPDSILGESTLTDWLTHYHAERVRNLAKMSDALAALASEWAERIAEEVQTLAPELVPDPGQRQGPAAYRIADAAGAMLSAERGR